MIKSKVTKKKCEVKYYSLSGKKHIVVLGGGMSPERDVSTMSAKNVCEGLVDCGYQVTYVDMGNDLAQIITEINPDLVFNALHGTYGEDGNVQGILNILQISYTHSGLLASAVAFDKIMTKNILSQNNFLNPKFLVVTKNNNLQSDPMPRPYVIKPVNQGSSIGVKVIFEGDDFTFAQYDYPYGKVIIEEYIQGKELQVAVLNGKALGVLEIKLLKNRFYDYESKYTEGFTEHILPAKIPNSITESVMKISEKLNDHLGCKGIIRVEFIYDEVKDQIYVIELNTHPGFTTLSLCPEIAAYANISRLELFEEIMSTAAYET